jgi:hypothetical protein
VFVTVVSVALVGGLLAVVRELVCAHRPTSGSWRYRAKT